MVTFFWITIFVVSLVVLLKASDIFTDAAEEIGLFLRFSPFIIGVTIVALGTSLPELVSSVFAVIEGASEIVAGTVIGSNIANIFLILGIVAVVNKKMKLDYEIINVDLPVLVASAFLLGVMAFDGKITITETILSLLALGIYLFRAISSGKHEPKQEQRRLSKEIKKELPRRSSKNFGLPWKSVIKLVLGITFVIISAKYTIDAAVELSTVFGLTKEVVGASIIALGTSLPELAISFKAALRGKGEIAVGNILGSNIFNSFGVIGAAGLFSTLAIPNSILIFSLPVMILATILYLFITQDKEVTSWEGAFLLVFYVLYLGKLLNFI